MRKLAMLLSLVMLLCAVGFAPMTATADTEPLEISVTTTEFGISVEGAPVQELWQDAMSKMLGRELIINYEFINIGDYGTKCKLILSTGSLPDILTIGWVDHTELIRYGDQGMFVELTQNWDKLPNYKAVFDGDAEAVANVMTTEGKVYGFYNAAYYPDGNPSLNYGSAVRGDTFEELGLAIPTTLDEFYEAAKAIKAAKPDVYPIFQHEDWEKPEDCVLAAYHTSTGRYYDGEKYVYGPISDEYREGLRYMNKIYAEGLISPDYFTHTQETGIAAVANGEVFMALNLWNGYCNTNNWGKDYPEQKWTLIPYLAAGEGVAEGDWMFDAGFSSPWRINKAYSRVISADSAHIEECLKILDYEYSQDMNDIHTWGVEGLTFEFDADGNRLYTQAYINGELKDSGLGSGSCRAGIFPELQNNSLYVSNQTSKPMLVYDIFTDKVIEITENAYAIENINPAYTSPKAPALTISSDDASEYANIYNLVKTVADEWRVKFIQGSASLDDDWETYLSEIAAMGDIDEMLDFYNKYLTK